MPDTFDPPQRPTMGKMPMSVSKRVLSAPFGDGYRQEGGDGLNTTKRSLPVSWDNLTPAQADTIEAFFEAHRGYDMFLWTPTGQTTERQWTVKNWSRNPANYGLEAMTAQFEQVFDI